MLQKNPLNRLKSFSEMQLFKRFCYGRGSVSLQGQQVCTPNVAKDLKFVAKDVTIAHDFLSNFNLFLETLVHV